MSNSFVADFKPHVPNGAFRRWLEKAVPAVYDESLSYYELVTKLLKYCGDVLEQVDMMGENSNSVYLAYIALEQYVKETFDVPSEVAKAMDEAATDGTFDKLLLPIVENYVPSVGENGNWFVNGTDTGHSAAGVAGGYYRPIVDKVGDVLTFKFVPSSQDMPNVEPANAELPKGADGVTPNIGENGNWYIGGADTGVKAMGVDGNSITVIRSATFTPPDSIGTLVTRITFSDGTEIDIPGGAKGMRGEPGADGGYYTVSAVDNGDGTVTFNFTPSKSSMGSVDSVTVALPSGSDSGQNVSGLTTAQVNALDGMFRVCAYTQEGVSAQYNAFRAAFGLDSSGGGTTEKTLTGISATYSGGDVAVGTAVTALTGVVVTAHYSDDTSETVTGYTLSGSIAEGENTVTVSYGDKTTTFTVTGMGESGGDAVNLYSGQYLKSANIDQHSENGNVFTYTPTGNGATITYTIEGLEKDKEYTIFVESDTTTTAANANYTQATVNSQNGASYSGKLVTAYVAGYGGKNYATFTATGGTMYLWFVEYGNGGINVEEIMRVYIYEGTLTERP